MLSHAARRAVWLTVYLLFVLAPVLALLLGDLPPARDFWTEFSSALAYVGLAMMGLQFGLTARFRHVTEPWGEDVIYHFHRLLSLIALGLVIAHPVILFIIRPARLRLLNFFIAPPVARWAAVSTYSLIALVVTSLWRVQLRIRYETWHVTHILLAVLAIVAGTIHMIGWGFYLGDARKRALWIALAIFWVVLLFYVRILKPLFILRRPYIVTEVRKERGDSWTLAMQPLRGRGFRFTPGQFGWLTIWGGPFTITGHPFSFSSSAEGADRHVEMTIRNLGDWTSRIREVPVGRRVYIDGPYGAFIIGNPADMHVLIAGGVGITPMMSIIRTLADRGDQRPVILMYGSRDWESITFREELEALKARLDLEVVHVLSDPPADWKGESGFIDADLMMRHLPPPYQDHEYFICGPNAMMDAVEKALGGMQVAVEKYHSERYSFV
jgi:predicted ferric reductase